MHPRVEGEGGHCRRVARDEGENRRCIQHFLDVYGVKGEYEANFGGGKEGRQTFYSPAIEDDVQVPQGWELQQGVVQFDDLAQSVERIGILVRITARR